MYYATSVKEVGRLENIQIIVNNHLKSGDLHTTNIEKTTVYCRWANGLKWHYDADEHAHMD